MSNYFYSDFFKRDKNLEKETFTVKKNGVKTTINIFFDSYGYAVDIETLSEFKDTTEDLQKMIEEAVAEEDYIKAAELKKRKDLLTNK
jgi:uncharacterized membrane protein (DUF106 family)